MCPVVHGIHYVLNLIGCKRQAGSTRDSNQDGKQSVAVQYSSSRMAYECIGLTSTNTFCPTYRVLQARAHRPIALVVHKRPEKRAICPCHIGSAGYPRRVSPCKSVNNEPREKVRYGSAWSELTRGARGIVPSIWGGVEVWADRCKI